MLSQRSLLTLAGAAPSLAQGALENRVTFCCLDAEAHRRREISNTKPRRPLFVSSWFRIYGWRRGLRARKSFTIALKLSLSYT